MIYYFRQPNKNIESYEIYQNTSLTKVGEVLVDTLKDYRSVVWAIRYLNSLNKWKEN